MTDADPADRVRRLLLSADNALKNAADGATPERIARVRETLEQAQVAARDPAISPAVRELVDRRLDSLATLEAGDGNA
jgi:hypothetical protein